MGSVSNIDFAPADPDDALQRLHFGEVDFIAVTPRTMVRDRDAFL